MYRKNCGGLTFPETVFTLNQLCCKNTKKKTKHEIISVDVSLQSFPGGCRSLLLV